MRFYFLIVALLSFISTSSNASDDYRAIAIEAKNRAAKEISVYRQDAENAKRAEKNLVQFYQSDSRFSEKQQKDILLNTKSSGKIGSSAKRMSSIPGLKHAGTCLIFVSFSMPTQSLEAYLRDAKKIHASVVIRGLIDNSFQKTYKRIADLVKASGGDGVELNPIWFKRFGIQVVPAVVIVPEGSPCFKNDVCKKDNDLVLNSSLHVLSREHDGTSFDVMTGDITLSSALKIIRDRRHLTSDIAQTALSKLQGLSDA